MSTQPAESAHTGNNLEFPVQEQLARAKPWEPSLVPVLDDLSDEEQAEFLEALRR